MNTQVARGDKGDPYDAVVIGGSFAGLAAALYLARARRRVLIYDSGLTRNRFAAHAHGFLGQDGRSPLAIRMAGRSDVLAYPTVELREEVVEAVTRGDLFTVTGASGTVLARRVILAHGMRDVLPDLPGFAESWGQSVVGCPYCHGYELADRPTALLMLNPMALHQAAMLRDWTDDLTVFSNGHEIGEEDRAALKARGTALCEARVVALEQVDGQVSALVLEGGERIAREVVYAGPQAVFTSDLAVGLGCVVLDGPMGPYLQVDDWQHTPVPGVFAAGDIARPMYGATLAAADGMRAGVACHRSLL